MIHAMDQEDIDGTMDDAPWTERWMIHAIDQGAIDGVMDDANEGHRRSDG